MRRFCVRCGVEEPELIIDRLCVKCFVDEGRAIKPPDNVELVICSVCGSVRYGGKWLIDVEPYNFIKDLILRGTAFYKDFKLKSLEVSVVDNKAAVRFEGSILGVEVVKDYSVGLTVNKVLCQQCSRVKGGYYEALIQVRTLLTTLRNSLRDRITDIVINSDISRYVLEIENVKEGINIKVLSQSIARKLASDLVNMYGGVISESWKDFGISNSGRRTSKLTLSVKLLGILPGDFIIFKDDIAVVDDVIKDLVKIRFLSSNELVRLRVQDLNINDLVLLSSDEYELVNAYVAGVVGGKVLVEELTSGRIYELPAVVDIKVGSKVKLLVYKDRIYLVNVRK